MFSTKLQYSLVSEIFQKKPITCDTLSVPIHDSGRYDGKRPQTKNNVVFLKDHNLLNTKFSYTKVTTSDDEVQHVF